MIVETFRQAIQNVWSNKLRTFLTTSPLQWTLRRLCRKYL